MAENCEKESFYMKKGLNYLFIFTFIINKLDK